jgi:hypothetical protein
VCSHICEQSQELIHREGHSTPALHVNIRLTRKNFQGINTLAYFTLPSVTKKRSVLTPGSMSSSRFSINSVLPLQMQL